MCPDPQILSIYLDGELPSPWKEKMEDHFAHCPKCKEKLESYKRLQLLFKKETSVKRTYVERVVEESSEEKIYTEEGMLKAKDRVWEKFEKRFDTKKRFMPRHTLWRRKLSIPLPAAAAIVVILMAVFLLREPVTTEIAERQTGQGLELQQIESTSFSIATEMERIEEIPGILPTADIGGILQYLMSNTSTNIIILQLPESKNFSRSGEPAIIRAADFQQNIAPGR